MKLLLLSDTYSEHTEKWALGLAGKGIEVGLFSFNKASYEWYTHPNITVFYEPEKKINAESAVTKLAYIKYVGILKKIIRHFKPDILHAHYATSYGLVGALCDFHPYVISSWGTDVMKFPNKNIVAKSLLKYNFNRADFLCATSDTIKTHVQKITKKDVAIVPFGIDTTRFLPAEVSSVFENTDFVIGSIKPLEKIYNLDVLLRAFAALRSKYAFIKLLIVGEGSATQDLMKLAEELKVDKHVHFSGRIAFSEVQNYYNMLDVLVNISEYESFGVSVAEAMACGKPVVVTDVGGLREIVRNDELGIKVQVRNLEQTTAAIERLITDKEAYKKMAAAVRPHIVKNYEWNTCLETMIGIYQELLKSKKKKGDTKTH